MVTGYDKIYSALLPRLAECDIAGQARQLGLEPDGDGAVPVIFLGRPYRITNQGVEVEDGAVASVNNRSLLIYYILSEGRVPNRDCFVPLHRLTGTIEGSGAQGDWFLSKSLLRETGGSYALFEAAARAMGGSHQGKLGGGQCWRFQVLPRLPVQLVFFEADDEFPAEIQFQFDESAPHYMGFECLAFLSGSVLHALTEKVKEQKAGPSRA